MFARLKKKIEHFILNCTKNKSLTEHLKEICEQKGIEINFSSIQSDNGTSDIITDFFIIILSFEFDAEYNLIR